MGLTKQEIFDRAYIGLRSQGFTQCTSDPKEGRTICVYDDGKGKHCAWGWVDKDSWGSPNAVTGLASMGRGEAGRLGEQELEFARRVQCLHDSSYDAISLEHDLVCFARNYRLTIPDDSRTVDWL